MRKILWISTLAGALVSASCSREEVPAASPALAIGFSPVTEMETKAYGMITDSTFSVNGRSIGVFAYNTGHYKYDEVSTNPNFMYNEKVTCNINGTDTTWTYSPLKYWPNGEGDVTGNTGERPEYLSFFAYAPYSDPEAKVTDADKCITAFNLQEEPGNPWLLYQLAEDPAHQVDVLFATNQRNQIKPEITGKVNLVFHHALACIGEQVQVSCSVLMQDEVNAMVDGVIIKKAQLLLRRVYVTYHLTARARLNLYSTGYIARWEPLLNGEQTTDRIVTYGPDNVLNPEILYSTDSSEIPEGGVWLSPPNKGILYIPYDRIADPQTFTVTAEYLIRTFHDDSTYFDGPDQVRNSSTILLSSYPEAFAPSRRLSKLTINLTVN